MPEITRDKFIEATGIDPLDDDLERCNCPLAGTVGHLFCGWNETFDKPQFMIGMLRVKRGEWPEVDRINDELAKL